MVSQVVVVAFFRQTDYDKLLALKTNAVGKVYDHMPPPGALIHQLDAFLASAIGAPRESLTLKALCIDDSYGSEYSDWDEVPDTLQDRLIKKTLDGWRLTIYEGREIFWSGYVGDLLEEPSALQLAPAPPIALPWDRPAFRS